MNSVKTIQLSENRKQVWSYGAEQYAVRLTLDISHFIAAWPDGQASVAFERADGKKYAHAYTVDGNELQIPLLQEDTSVNGVCKLTVAWTQGMGVARTAVFYGEVRKTITSLGEKPTPPEQGIIEQCNNAASRAEIAAKRAEEAVGFETDETLTMKDGILSVNTAKVVERDNMLPVASAAVYATVGNINVLLETI